MKAADPIELRKLTAAAIQRGQQAAAVKAKQDAEQQLKQATAEQLKAEDVIAPLPGACELAASAGRSCARVMRLSNEEFNCPRNGKPIEILRAAKIVFEFCAKAGLSPSVTQWDDGVGIKGGYDIYVKW